MVRRGRRPVTCSSWMTRSAEARSHDGLRTYGLTWGRRSRTRRWCASRRLTENSAVFWKKWFYSSCSGGEWLGAIRQPASIEGVNLRSRALSPCRGCENYLLAIGVPEAWHARGERGGPGPAYGSRAFGPRRETLSNL